MSCRNVTITAIAANPEYSSLNLAMAVQVIAYEVRMAWLATQEQEEPAASTKRRRIRWLMIERFTATSSKPCWPPVLFAPATRGR
jgi:tRNA C32,U32 (ribose-2'-O)-methylase TrmJ